MVFQVKRSLSTTGVILNLIKSAILFLSLFLVCELSVTVEAKSVATSTYKNVTILSKTRRYLTIGTQGITGETSNGPYGKISYFHSCPKSMFPYFNRLVAKLIVFHCFVDTDPFLQGPLQHIEMESQ